MGQPHFPEPACLIIGLLARNDEWMQLALERISAQFGDFEHTLGPFPFTWTNYYADELGQNPLRMLVSFSTPYDRSQLPSTKILTNQWEDTWADAQGRPVNVDPGYMTLGQFFLASTKDQRQRVYLEQGIYAEPTLFYEGGVWKAFPWTYRDWQSEEYRPFFDTTRQRFAYQRTTGRKWADR
jgi:hypothetical protein